MTRRTIAIALAVLASLLAPVRPAPAADMGDSTAIDGWRLANGLEVRVRHVPGAAGVVLTTGYRSGLLDDPAGREGLSELLAELQFFAPAGDVPERTRAEMPSLRPLGWRAATSQRLTSLTEVATLPQFPGALRQVATRMAGVTVTPAALSAAREAVRREMGLRALGQPDQVLYWRVHALAAGVPDEALVAAASGRGLEGLKPADAARLLAQRFVPANACLALAGDFSNMNLRALVESEFGSIPGGAARPEAAGVALRGGERVSRLPGLGRPVGVLGIVAPALDDTLHPAFYLAGLMVGLQLRRDSGAPADPLTARFQFSAVEEPELLRLYPDLPAGDTEPAALAAALDYVTESLGRQAIKIEALDSVKRAFDWLLGGPLPNGLRLQAQQAPGMLTPLTTAMAARALHRGDDFWERYRKTFETTPIGPSVFFKWMLDPEHQARLVLTPKR